MKKWLIKYIFLNIKVFLDDELCEDGVCMICFGDFPSAGLDVMSCEIPPGVHAWTEYQALRAYFSGISMTYGLITHHSDPLMIEVTPKAGHYP
jgi:hypothetical protein